MHDDDIPDGRDTGWQSGPRLYDSELLTLTLCRYTGEPPMVNGECAARAARQHRDVECFQLFFSAEALKREGIDFLNYDGVPREIRLPEGGDEATGVME